MKAADVIDWDFEVEDSEGGVRILFSTLDRVMEYGIDITGLNVSQERTDSCSQRYRGSIRARRASDRRTSDRRIAIVRHQRGLTTVRIE